MPYVRRVLEVLLNGGHAIHCVVSPSGARVLEIEEQLLLDRRLERSAEVLRRWAGAESGEGELTLHHHQDVAAPIASGSFPLDGMVIAPCSGSTLARVAQSLGGGLVERAAEVCLKERKRLILVPREAPLSLGAIRNMLSVTEMGAIVLPASPGFYHRPQSIADLVDMVAGRVCSLLGQDSAALRVWSGPPPTEKG